MKSEEVSRPDTLCWNCSKPYLLDCPKCPHCNATNGNIDRDAAMRESLSYPALDFQQHAAPPQGLVEEPRRIEPQYLNLSVSGLWVKQWQDYADALRSRLNAQEGRWMPIETAPKDGTEILAWHIEGGNWHQVKWKEHRKAFGMRWANDYEQMEGHYSHWTPLPPSPTAGGSDKGDEHGR